MTTPEASPDEPLDFSTSTTTTLTCAGCQGPLTDSYWSAGGAVLCADCKAAVEAGQQAAPDPLSRVARLTRATVFGLGGMLVGASVWYLVERFAQIRVGLIAILLGWLVGKAVFIGSGRRGGTHYQILAVVLTYLGFGAAYLPFLLGAARERGTPLGSAMASQLLLLLPRLPIMVVQDGTLITGAIFLFGLLQAWNNTRAIRLEISGPFTVTPPGT